MRTGITAAICVFATTIWTAPDSSAQTIRHRGVAAGGQTRSQNQRPYIRGGSSSRGSAASRSYPPRVQASGGRQHYGPSHDGRSHRSHSHYGRHHGRHHHFGHGGYGYGGYVSPFSYGYGGYYSPYSYFAPGRVDVFAGYDVYVRPGTYIGYGIPPQAVGIYAPYQVIPPTGWGGDGPEVFNNEAIRDALDENAERWQQPLDIEPAPQRAVRLPEPSTPEAKLRSIRLQGRGDYWMHKQEYSQAYRRYTEAAEAAPDRPEVYFRKALALVALNHYPQAVREMKRLLEIDPAWPTHGESLTDVYGRDNQLAKMSFLDRVADWVRADIRDPDRLFLMGTLLYFDDARDKAMPFFEAAWRLSGGGDHLRAFLSPTTPANPQAAANQAANANNAANPVPADAIDEPRQRGSVPAIESNRQSDEGAPTDSDAPESAIDGPELIPPTP